MIDQASVISLPLDLSTMDMGRKLLCANLPNGDPFIYIEYNIQIRNTFLKANFKKWLVQAALNKISA